MARYKKFIALLLSFVLLVSMVPAMGLADDSGTEASGELDLAAAIADGTYTWELCEDESGEYYQLSNVVYCTNPTDDFYDDDGHYYQSMVIIVPTEYLNEDGTVNSYGFVNGYTAETAPIIIKNNCQGWNSSKPTTANDDSVITYRDYIDSGFIYIGCGARSRNIDNGTAPAPVVDIKAAIRYIRLNDAAIPGTSEKLVSMGGSGAGEMSSVIGASGNMSEYYEYLYDIGAAGIDYVDGEYVSTISDAVDACMAFYPIADIENADMAYAWLRFDSGETAYRTTEFSEFQLALQDDLAVAFCEYVNGLELTDEDGNSLTFNEGEDGTLDPRSGSYYAKILQNLSDALNKYLAYYGEEATEELIAGYSDTEDWLVKNDDGTYSVTDISGMLNGTGLARNKNIPGFDTFTLGAENNAFGTIEEGSAHYSKSVAAVLKANYDRYSELEGFAELNEETNEFTGKLGLVDSYVALLDRDDGVIDTQTYLMNATSIMFAAAAGEQETDIAPYWRIRSGTADQHTSFSVGYNMALAAMENDGIDVDYSLVWDMIHGSEIEGESTGTFLSWVEEIFPPFEDMAEVQTEVLARDMSEVRMQGNYMPVNGMFSTTRSDGNTVLYYIGEGSQPNELLTVVACPDDVATLKDAAKFASDEGWLEMADYYGECLAIIPAPADGWSDSVADDYAYINAAVPTFGSDKCMTVYGCRYLVGYSESAGAMQYYAAQNPLGINSQVYIDAAEDVSTSLAAAGAELLGTWSDWDAELEAVAKSDIAVPTWFIGDYVQANVDYWAAGAEADNITTSYSDVNVVVKQSAANSESAQEIVYFLNDYIRYENSTVYGNSLRERKVFEENTDSIKMYDFDWTDPASGYTWNREYIVYVPENVQENAPVVYCLHGATNSANLFFNATGWAEVADELGYIIVYLNGTVTQSNPSRCSWLTIAEAASTETRIPSESIPSDMDYIQEVIARVDAEYDTAGSTRRYIYGNSAGSMNSNLNAQVFSDSFTALGTTSGPIMGDNATEQMTMVRISGTALKAATAP